MPLIATDTDTGTVLASNVVVAATRATRAAGLMARENLDPGEALWIVPSRGVHTCWMRFAIDVIALDDKGVIIDRVVNLKPWRIRLPRRGTAGVLELRAGTLDAAGAHIGHRIEFAQGSSRLHQLPQPLPYLSSIPERRRRPLRPTRSRKPACIPIR